MARECGVPEWAATKGDADVLMRAAAAARAAANAEVGGAAAAAASAAAGAAGAPLALTPGAQNHLGRQYG